MRIDYYSSLKNKDKVCYDIKLMLANGIKLEDPYSMMEGWGCDITELPNDAKAAWSDVTSCLIDTPSIYTKESV